MVLIINNLTTYNLDGELEIPWSVTPWNNNSKNQTTPLYIFDSEGFLEFNRNWTYVDRDRDGIISDGDEIIVYSLYKNSYSLRLGTDLYTDPNKEYACGCSLMTVTIEGEIRFEGGD